MAGIEYRHGTVTKAEASNCIKDPGNRRNVTVSRVFAVRDGALLFACAGRFAPEHQVMFSETTGFSCCVLFWRHEFKEIYGCQCK
jgi:hypothetical protein